MLPADEGGGRLVRAIITEGDNCPKIVAGASTAPMRARPSRIRSAFPVLLCEGKLPTASDANEAWVGSHRVPVRPRDPGDIVVLGDTGCRMVHWQIQPCLNGLEWPFGAVAHQAAKTIQNSGSRSIIIHVGDFHYRENPCADGNKDCGGSPFGDNWATWEEEFFKPAQPLLLAAPWVILRGNHEDCARSGAGWLFFFGSPDDRYEGACEHDRKPYRLDIGQSAPERRRVLLVLDTAYEKDSYGIVERCETYQEWMKAAEQNDAEVWLLLHQPLWFRDPDGGQQSATKPTVPCQKDATRSALDAIRAHLIDERRSVSLILSGDLHVFQFFQPTDPMPVQIVAGASGTRLDDLRVMAPDAKKSERALIESAIDTGLKPYGVSGTALTVKRHGFVTMHREDASWMIELRDVKGQTVASCRFSSSVAATGPAGKVLECPVAPNGVVADNGLQRSTMPDAGK